MCAPAGQLGCSLSDSAASGAFILADMRLRCVSIIAGAYFTYLLVMLVTSLSMSGLFRFIGSIAATSVHAQVKSM